MKAAALGPRARQLILFEPNPFPLLVQNGRMEAFDEVADLRDVVRRAGVSGDWLTAGQRSADHWGGAGTWARRRLSGRQMAWLGYR